MDVFVRCPQKWARGNFEPMTRCSIETWLEETKQSGINSPPTLFDAPPLLSRFICSSLDPIQLKSSRDAGGTGGWADGRMGGQAKRFRVAPWRHSIHPRSRYRYCIGIPNPGRRGSSQVLRTGTKNRSGNPKSHINYRNVLEWRQGVPNWYQCVGWLQRTSEPTGGPKT